MRRLQNLEKNSGETGKTLRQPFETSSGTLTRIT